jgi:hypothetical protein
VFLGSGGCRQAAGTGSFAADSGGLLTSPIGDATLFYRLSIIEPVLLGDKSHEDHP